MMDKNALKARLRGTDQFKLLAAVADAVGDNPGDEPNEYVSTESAGKSVGIGTRDVMEYTRDLEALGLLRSSGRMSGGHQPTAMGRTVVRELQESQATGQDRYDHTAREILRHMAEKGQDVTWTEVASWDLHKPGLPEVTEQERETCMKVLESQGYIHGFHSAQQDFVRTRLEPKGRVVLGSPDVSLTGSLFSGSSSVTYDQRSGVHGSFTNQGGNVQIGDQNVMVAPISNDQRQQVLADVQAVRALLDANPEYDAAARAKVVESLDEVEAEANGSRDPGVIRRLAEKASGAAVAALGSTGGIAIAEALGRLVNTLG